ncbi:hypothetical protein [Paenibacillus sp. DS2015]|uniref:hypothetical protein n=1 Tax=Paenibacillus sp. DS2015 TaxID=3373917 RepID=UPI003D232A56
MYADALNVRHLDVETAVILAVTGGGGASMSASATLGGTPLIPKNNVIVAMITS